MKKAKVALLTALTGSILLHGCAPAPPPPPLLGPGDVFRVGWLFIILLGGIVYLLWKKNNSEQRSGSDHLSDAINDINDRLKKVEERIEELLKHKNE